ncbi:MAG: hypothetical protein WDW36_005615 [Sanguina aurantia]
MEAKKPTHLRDVSPLLEGVIFSTHEREQAERAHLQSFVDRFKATASKAKQAQSRMKRLEKMAGTEAVRADRSFHFSFAKPERLPDSMLQLEDIVAGYPDEDGGPNNIILDGVRFSLEAGDRIGLLGPNGAGKSTLVKTLVGELDPFSGERKAHKDLKIGYFAQHTVESLRAGASPMEHLLDKAPTVATQVMRDFLGTWNFAGERAFESVDGFSGGERARLALALIAWDKPNLLLLDEPTNHLDLDMREALADALSDFDGALVLVSHDRHLLGLVCDSFYRVADGVVEDFDGDLDDYAKWLRSRGAANKKAAKAGAAAKAAPVAVVVVETPEERKRNHAVNRENEKVARQRVKKIETRTATIDTELGSLETQLADPATYLSTTIDMPTLHVWLPALPSAGLRDLLATRLLRATRIADGRRGYLSGLGDYFHDAAGAPVTGTLPAAAITRNHVAKDADGHTWLSADPAWVQPEMNGVRLLACGHMQLTQAEAEAYAEALQPALEDAGMALYLSTPDRWHLRLPPGTPLPDFAAPEQALGEDLSQHLPAGAEGRRWRILLNDMQVLLHQHPLNTARQNRGVAPVNCLWLWGGGTLPAPLRSPLSGVIGDDLLLAALATQAGIEAVPRTPEAVAGATRGWLIDLQDLPLAEIESRWWLTLESLLGRHPLRRREARGVPSGWPDSVHLVLQQIYAARGVFGPDQVEHRLARMLSPQALGGMPEAIALLVEAIREDWSIVIAGDYDCDGATGTAVAVRGLRMLGATHVTYAVPHRFIHGYGLSAALVESMQPTPQLIVTVDNGVASVAGVAAAKARGIKVIVTDHHLPGEQLPAADAMVNPNLVFGERCGHAMPPCAACAHDGALNKAFPSKALAGVGVMFYLLLALRARLRELGTLGTPEPDLSVLLDLVALGTVADLVPLDFNNRVLIEAGLKRIRSGRACPGITALVESGKRSLATLGASDLGFVVGPRLNAAGRLEDMRLGIECLLTDDVAQARRYADQLSAINMERRDLQASMVAEAEVMADGAAHTDAVGVTLFEPSWHAGVVGLVASKLKDRLHRPVIAFAPASDENTDELRGSARSISGFHIRDALAAIDARQPGLIERFGGGCNRRMNFMPGAPRGNAGQREDWEGDRDRSNPGVRLSLNLGIMIPS